MERECRSKHAVARLSFGRTLRFGAAKASSLDRFGSTMRLAARVLTAAALCAILAVEARAAGLRYRVLAQGAVRQAVDGRLWLYAAGHGWMERIELGQIRAGDLETVMSGETFPERWPFAEIGRASCRERV